MEITIQNLKSCAKRFWVLLRRIAVYTAIRMMIMGVLYAIVHMFELTELVNVNRITISPTLTEMLSIYNGWQSTPVILARCMLNLIYHSEYILSIEVLFALYKLFNCEQFSTKESSLSCCLMYAWYSLLKFVMWRFLMWTWNLNEVEWPVILNDPSNIHVMLTFQQIDAIEFSFKSDENDEIGNWYPHLKMTAGIFVGLISEMLNYNRLYEAIKQLF